MKRTYLGTLSVMLVLALMLGLAVSPVSGESVQAGVRVKLRPAGDIYEGDTVTLRAEVSGAEEGSYSVLWQKKTVADDGSVKWKKLAEGRKYDLTAAEAIEGMVIRAVLVIGDNKIFSEPVTIPKILTRPAPDPTEAPDTGSDEDPTPGPTGEQTEVRDPDPDATPTPDAPGDPTDPTPGPTEDNIIEATPGPTEEPTPEPTEEPTPEPTEEPTPEPTEEPTPEPTEEPTPEPTEEPTPEPTEEPTPAPTEEPTPEPTEEPTPEPTEEPTPAPTEEPNPEPTEEPTPEPTEEPTPEPTEEPTPAPIPDPIPEPTEAPMPVSSEAPISVAIHSAVSGPAGIGEKVTLIADVPEGYAVQWQYSADGGITAADIEGAVFSTYTFVLTEENMDYLYRVRVTPIAAAVDR